MRGRQQLRCFELASVRAALALAERRSTFPADFVLQTLNQSQRSAAVVTTLNFCSQSSGRAQRPGYDGRAPRLSPALYIERGALRSAPGGMELVGVRRQIDERLLGKRNISVAHC